MAHNPGHRRRVFTQEELEEISNNDAELFKLTYVAPWGERKTTTVPQVATTEALLMYIVVYFEQPHIILWISMWKTLWTTQKLSVRTVPSVNLYFLVHRNVRTFTFWRLNRYNK